MQKKLLGAEHPDTLLSMGNLASTYSNQGKWNEAEQLEVQVLDMQKNVLGVEHQTSSQAWQSSKHIVANS